MDWIMQWVKDLAYYFIFLGIITHLLPEGEERKYIRFFLGMLLVLLLSKPLLQLGNEKEILEEKLWKNMLEESQEEIQSAAKDTNETRYIKTAWEREMYGLLAQFMAGCGYELESCTLSFFDESSYEVKQLTLKIKEEIDAVEEENIKNKLLEVYGIPEGNINVVGGS